MKFVQVRMKDKRRVGKRKESLRLEALTAVKVSSVNFCVVTPCSFEDDYQHLGET